MLTFTIGLGHAWWIRVWGTNPLVRGSDRLEALVLALAVLIIVVTAPFAAAVGTSVYDSRSRLFLDEAQSTHQVTATAVSRGTAVAETNGLAFVARATWKFAGRDHTDVVDWPNRAKVGDQQALWVDAQGEPGSPPPSRDRAAGDAVGAGLGVWLGIAALAAGGAHLARRRLIRWRYVQWDKEITTTLAGGDGGLRST